MDIITLLENKELSLLISDLAIDDKYTLTFCTNSDQQSFEIDKHELADMIITLKQLYEDYD